jgi:hypothetical protein
VVIRPPWYWFLEAEELWTMGYRRCAVFVMMERAALAGIRAWTQRLPAARAEKIDYRQS